MSEADKMFEKLKYIKKIDDEHVLLLVDSSCEIRFWKKEKVFYKCTDTGGYTFITLEELKAINKKCQELGWI